MDFSHLVACSRNRVIGHEGQLPWHLPADLKRFKELTMGHAIIMGRKTYESIGRPLPGRFSIVISRQKADLMLPRTASLVHSLEEAYALAASLAPHWGEESFIIGGGEIYRQTIDVVRRIYLTEVETEVVGDTTYPDFDRSLFECIQKEGVPGRDPSNLAYTFYTYERRQRL